MAQQKDKFSIERRKNALFPNQEMRFEGREGVVNLGSRRHEIIMMEKDDGLSDQVFTETYQQRVEEAFMTTEQKLNLEIQSQARKNGEEETQSPQLSARTKEIEHVKDIVKKCMFFILMVSVFKRKHTP